MQFTTKTDALVRALKNAIVYASTDKSRPVLCAVQIQVRDGEIQVQATDSYSLFRTTVPAESTEPGETLLQVADAKEIVKRLGKSTNACRMQETDTGRIETTNYLGDVVHIAIPELRSFPDCDSLVQSFTNNENYYAGLSAGAIAKVDTGKKPPKQGAAIKLEHGKDELSALRATFPDDPAILILIMPCRMP